MDIQTCTVGIRGSHDPRTDGSVIMARQRVGTTRNDCSPGGPQALAEVTDLTGLVQRPICSSAAAVQRQQQAQHVYNTL